VPVPPDLVNSLPITIPQVKRKPKRLIPPV